MDEIPECPICLDIYGMQVNHIKAPKILLCGHTLCKECLENIVNKTEGETFECPICKEKIKKEKNIDDYIINKEIIRIINKCFNVQEETNEKQEGEGPINFNIVLLGNCAVGKTSIIKRFSKEIFSENLQSTIGTDITIYFIKYKEKKYKLTFRDTSGQEKFQAVTKSYLRNSDGVLFVYDISNKDSFNALETWYNLYKEENENVVGILIGNKSDTKHAVNKEEAKKFAKDHGLKKYLETSAKLDKNIKKAIAFLLDQIIKAKRLDYDPVLEETNFSLASNEYNKGKKKCAC